MRPPLAIQRALVIVMAMSAAATTALFAWTMIPMLPSPPEPDPRPPQPLVAAVIENHVEARPYQEGLPEADVVFEVLVEGEISRFLALYSADRLPTRIGPIRSLRRDFLELLTPYTPLLLHIGGSEEARATLDAQSGIVDHDGIRFDGETYERDPAVPPPHNLFITREAVLRVLRERAVPPHPLPLLPTGEQPREGTGATTITVNFLSPLHNVTFTFDGQTRSYVRSSHRAPLQAQPSTVVVLGVPITAIGELGKLTLDTLGQGPLLAFHNGALTEGIWLRLPDGPFTFLTKRGEPLPVAPGQTWILLFPDLSRVRWHPAPVPRGEASTELR